MQLSSSSSSSSLPSSIIMIIIIMGRIAATLFLRDMVCLRNTGMCINTLHKGDIDDDNNNNNRHYHHHFWYNVLCTLSTF
jgi:hypothetical protein